jgi:hypothetical protein
MKFPAKSSRIRSYGYDLRESSMDYCAAEEGNNLQPPAPPAMGLAAFGRSGVIVSQVRKSGPGAPGFFLAVSFAQL